ncbi:hypothetical protein C4577_01165 [Candidatus Parcubacteria bacterium]|nr:MAG: hypothetical protein C4577_01165 [Candidatus Parcubacteria bacterium]
MIKHIALVFVLITFLFFSRESTLAQSSPSAVPKVEYQLPYPGVLPDNPLYFLKAARDRLVSILINDPLKKSEFNLLNSDKRIGAGIALVEKDKDALAVSVISKSNNYLFDAVIAAEESKKLGKDTKSLSENIRNSILKHKEKIEELEKLIDKKYVKELKSEYKRLEIMQESVKQNLLK